MKKLKLSTLEDGTSTGLSVRYGAFLAEAASVSLDVYTHPNPVKFKVDGTVKKTYDLVPIEITDVSKVSFSDLDEAVQFGAMGVAIAIVNEQKGYKVARSWKGTGFDYWVGEESESSLFENKLRLEISGDRSGTDTELKSRLRSKLQQTVVSDDLNLPAWAVIVEFSTPKSLIGNR